jgi:LTXXQ motif family protein
MSQGKRGSAQGGNLATMCSRQVGAITVPAQRIAQVVEPNTQQQGAFDELKKVSENAADQLQKSCPTQVPQTPLARLDAVEQRLGAIVDAMKTIRPRLESFYASLTDEQKAKFNTVGPPPQNASSQPP